MIIGPSDLRAPGETPSIRLMVTSSFGSSSSDGRQSSFELPSVRKRSASTPSDRLRIAFISHAPHLAPSHYRLALPARALTDAGHECFVGSAIVSAPSGEVFAALPGNTIVQDIDILVVQPGVGTEWVGIVEGARQFGQIVVVDVDDWMWDLQASNVASQDDGWSIWLDRLRMALCASNVVTVSTPFLAERIGAWPGHHETVVLPNPIDMERWGGPEDVTDGPVIGYVGSLSGHAEDLGILRAWLGPFLDRHDLQIVHIGAHPTHPAFADLTGVDPGRVITREGRAWVDFAASRPMAGIDIGLVPLEARDYNRAKSALKGMEYAACGVPFVASPSPEYVRFNCGSLAGTSLEDQTPAAWEAALEQLLDAGERKRVARRQSERVAAEDISVRSGEWEHLYRRIGGRGYPDDSHGQAERKGPDQGVDDASGPSA